MRVQSISFFKEIRNVSLSRFSRLKDVHINLMSNYKVSKILLSLLLSVRLKITFGVIMLFGHQELSYALMFSCCKKLMWGREQLLSQPGLLTKTLLGLMQEHRLAKLFVPLILVNFCPFYG